MAGFDFYIIIQGKKEGQWYDLKSKNQRGSGYSFANCCYFFCERKRIGMSEESDGWSIYTFSYETLMADLEKFKSSVDLRVYLRDLSCKSIINQLDVDKLKRFIDNKNYPISDYARYLEQLNMYCDLCEKFIREYDDVRVIYKFRENKVGFNS